LEYAQTLNKSTGVVSTTSIMHATPAAFMAHTDSRNNYVDIVEDIVYDANVTVLLGGGTWRFSSSYQSTMASNGYTVVHDRAGMLSVTSGKLLGLFSIEDMDYESVRDYSTDPSLLEMTNQSLHILSQDPDGFFLMVEGGRIDHAAHVNNPIDVALETIEFQKAVERAIDYVDANPNTILIVTGDHETGGLTVVNSNLGSVLPADLTLESDKRDLRMERADNVTVIWTTTGHSDADVPIFCYGDEFSGLPVNYTIDNIDIYTLMKDYYQGNPLDVTDETAPLWFVAPSDREITEGESFRYWVPAVDVSDIEYAVNDTVNFAINSTGLITNLTSLVVGLYGLNVSVWDVHGNTAFREIIITVLAEITIPTTTTTTDTTNTTTTTGTGTPTGIPIDLIMLTIVGVGAAVVVVVILIVIKKR
jgi:hypothetical protein